MDGEYAENAGAIFCHPSYFIKKRINAQVAPIFYKQSGIRDGFRIHLLRVRVSPWVPNDRE